MPAAPIFIAKHPGNGDFYVSCDTSSKIARINPTSETVTELDIPPSAGTTPVGLIAGPADSVWFVLLGSPTAGTGTFGRVDAADNMTFYTLTSAVTSTASLLHLVFTAGQGGSPAPLWLLFYDLQQFYRSRPTGDFGPKTNLSRTGRHPCVAAGFVSAPCALCRGSGPCHPR